MLGKLLGSFINYEILHTKVNLQLLQRSLVWLANATNPKISLHYENLNEMKPWGRVVEAMLGKLVTIREQQYGRKSFVGSMLFADGIVICGESRVWRGADLQ